MNDELVEAIVALLAAHPTWALTNTPPELLGRHMVRSLELFESTLTSRTAHFLRPTGREVHA
jgi:hypothetical protein